MVLKINLKIIRYLFLIIAFIPPQCINSIENISSITQGLAVCRYIVSALAIAYLFSKKEYRKYVSKPFILFSFLAIISQIIALFNNGSLKLTVGLSCITFIGYIALNIILFNKDRVCLLKTYRNYLTLCLFLHAVTKILGISFYGSTEFDSVYFMGSKNMLTPYVILAFLCHALLEYRDDVKVKYKNLFVYSIFLSAVIIVNASSTGLGAMALIDVYLIVLYFGQRSKAIGKMLQRWYVLFSAFLVIAFFYFIVIHQGGNNFLTTAVTAIVGKDVTFSGRRAIWAAALQYIKSNLLWGMGLDVQYDVWNNNKYVYSAHNMFLDYGVKYGCFSLSLFIISLFFMLKAAISCKKNELVRFGILASSAVLFAALFEAIEGVYIVWGIFLIAYMISTKVKK